MVAWGNPSGNEMYSIMYSWKLQAFPEMEYWKYGNEICFHCLCVTARSKGIVF